MLFSHKSKNFTLRKSVYTKLPITTLYPVVVSAPSKSHESPVGGAAVGGMAAHGLVNGMSGASPTGMSEANLPRPHLRRAN